MNQRRQINSSYWLDPVTPSLINSNDDYSLIDIIKLSQVRKAVTNFVKILTNEDIPVIYKTSSNASFTNGKAITIGGKIKKDIDIDITVGLALHEASHILLSNFDIFTPLRIEKYCSQHFSKLFTTGTGYAAYHLHIVIDIFKNILNWIEDRRIDNYIKETSPGYVGYYDELYNKYFHYKLVTDSLQSDLYRTETIDSYMYRIINLINNDTDLDALKGLKEIDDIIDLDNIGRLKSTEDGVNLTIDVLKIIFKYVKDITKTSDSDSNKGNSKKGNSNENNLNKDNSNKQKSNNNLIKKRDNEVKRRNKFNKLNKRIAAQKKFLEHNVHKTVMTKIKSELINKFSNMNININKTSTNFPFIVVRDFNKKLLANNNRLIPILSIPNTSAPELDSITYYNEKFILDNVNLIKDGIVIGKKLLRKLKLRNEERETIYRRKNKGSLDKRLLYELGFDNNKVFSITDIDQYKKTHIRISVDASGSMLGNKWDNTLKILTAITYAIDKINNVELVIDFRTTTNAGIPLVLIAYDSRKDSFVKIKQLFKYIQPAGLTPEGIIFEGLMNEYVSGSNDRNSIFINLSDGVPICNYRINNNRYVYTCRRTEINHRNISNLGSALTHTKNQMLKFRNKNIKVLSYFVESYTDYASRYDKSSFQIMYGKNAEFIDANNIIDLSRTLNSRLMQK